MIQSLIKLGICETEEEKRDEYLENARGLASNGIRELREYILQNKKEKNGEIITWYLQKLVKTVKETAVELDFSGQDSEKYLVHSETVYECVKEFITNTLRYANATKIQIIVKFMEKEIELYLFDDGIGCKKLICGNGLNGMKNKVEKSRGVIRMNTAENEGFQIFLSLPV